MDNTAFEDALRKGLGRAIQHLRTADSAPYRDLILAACLEDWRFDRQVEESHSHYLYEVIQATGTAAFYRDALLRHLRVSAPDDLLPENIRLAREFATRGDAEMRRAVYRAFDSRSAAGDFDDGDELIEIDGWDGFVYAARAHLAGHPEDDDWQLSYWITKVEERVGEAAARAALEEAAVTWPEVAAAVQAGRERKEQIASSRADTREASLLPWPEMREAILNNRRPNGIGGSIWGRRADDAMLREAAEDIVAETDSERIFKLLFVFHRRAFPLPPGPLLELVKSAEVKVAWRAAMALSLVTHPEVRELALELSQNNESVRFAAKLMKSNWQVGDSGLLMRLIGRCETVDDVHSVGISVLEVAESHSVDEMTAPLLLLYEKGPCSMCRYGVVKSLMLRNALSAGIAEECRFDAYESTRKLIADGPDHQD